MLENWHQMVGNWLETIKYKYMNIYNACMRLLPFLWFSMKLGVINSFLVVCLYNGFKIIQIGEYLQHSCKNIM